MGKKFKKTMTQKALAANRTNAQKSTGPHDTSETRFNAQWHGRRGSQVVLKNEDPEEYRAFAQTYYDGLAPVGTYEHQLVKMLADRAWEWERVLRLKSQTMEETPYRDEMLNDLRILEGQHTAIERSMARISRELRAAQAARLKNHPSPPDGPPGTGHGEQDNTPQNGGVALFPTHETETWHGPEAQYRPSQGEVAITQLTRRAKRAIQDGRAPGYDTPIGRYFLKQADLQLSLEGCDDDEADWAAPPGANDDNQDDSPGYRYAQGS